MSDTVRHLRDNAFVISCAERSGSSFLVHLLRSHPGLFCHGEVFGDPLTGLLGVYDLAQRGEAFRRAAEELRRRDPRMFLYKIVFDTQGHDGVGFKFKTNESLRASHRKILRLILADTDIKVVFLTRRDPLAQYVSAAATRQSGVTLAHSDAERPQIEPIQVAPRELDAYIDDLARRQRRAERVYRHHRSFAIEYDDLVDDQQTRLAGLLSFLGVAPTPLTSTTVKIVDRPLSEMVLNYDEIRAHLARR